MKHAQRYDLAGKFMAALADTTPNDTTFKDALTALGIAISVLLASLPPEVRNHWIQALIKSLSEGEG